MKKFADRYLDVEPWALVETGFHPKKARVSESLFALGNEYMGARAYFEEGYSGDQLVGCYLNGLYEEHRVESSYKGISDRVCFMVNTVDWAYTRLALDGETLDLANSEFRDFLRRLDFRDGLLQRSFVWKTRSGKELSLVFQRFLSMETNELAYQRVQLRALNFSASLKVESGIDFRNAHESYGGQHHFSVEAPQFSEKGGSLSAQTVLTKMPLEAAFELRGPVASAHPVRQEKLAAQAFELELEQGKTEKLDKVVVLTRPERSASPNIATAPGFDAALDANCQYWGKVWELADIQIDGDLENQQGIRFCIFQLEQTFRGRTPSANIGAKGLTGEAYNGNAFWDTEAYCFPYYLLRNQDAAKALLDYRFDTLPQARERARALDCEGACYPIATIDGTESCNLWQHASLQFQPTTAVAYALSHYLKVTGDTGYIYDKGAEMLVEAARFLASRVGYSEKKGAYGFYAVMGPDEFQMMVNHNAYTNYMGAKSLAFAKETWEKFALARPAEADRLASKLGLRPAELVRWSEIAGNMFLPKEGELYEQHEGFFELPHVDIKAIPAEEFPLYHSWSYDRIYRNDMIKQPDVLMFMFLYNQEFSLEQKRINYEFYEPKTIHESSLSPSVHSIFATELGREQEAFDFFKFATRIDLDDYNRNAREGLHLTAISAAWMNIVYGFGGLRSDAESVSLAPRLPEAWNSLSFKFSYQGRVVRVDMEPGRTALSVQKGKALELSVFGKKTLIPDGGDSVVVVEGA